MKKALPKLRPMMQREATRLVIEQKLHAIEHIIVAIKQELRTL